MNPATQIVHWPGKDTPACDEHLRKLVGLGAILGIMITWTPCEEMICPNCESEIKKHEAAGLPLVDPDSPCEAPPRASLEGNPVHSRQAGRQKEAAK